MARVSNKLTALAVRNLKTPGLHSDGNGLYLQVTPAGSKSFVFRYSFAGKVRTLGLGASNVVSLDDARRKAGVARHSLSEGIDPLAAKRETAARLIVETQRHQAAEIAAAMTFKRCAEAYLEKFEPTWTHPKHSMQWRNSLANHVYPKIGDKLAAELQLADIVGVLEPMWFAVPETAGRVRARIETVMNYAAAMGFRSGDNPAAWSRLKFVLPDLGSFQVVKHYEALPFTELPVFYADLKSRTAMAARALELVIVTASRTSEVLNATWDEFDLKAKVWSLSAARMKADRPHVVPLSDAALELLERCKVFESRTHNLVVPGQKDGSALSNMAMLQLLKRMRPPKEHGGIRLTAHGFRSTFSTWASERTEHSQQVIEMSLAHAIGNAVEAAYRRGDLLTKRRTLMDEWGAFCNSSKPL